MHKLVRATRSGVEKAGRILRQIGADVKLKVADQVVAVADGAQWIGNLLQASLPKGSTVVLDYFHASEHVHKARRAVFGEEAADGRDWAEQLN